MAIQLIREFEDSGFSGNYWRLENLAIDRNGNGSAVFNLYKSQSDAQSGKRSVDSVTVQASGQISGSTTLVQIQTALENAAINTGAPLEGGTII